MFVTFRNNKDNSIHAININKFKDIYIIKNSLVFWYDIDKMIMIECKDVKSAQRCFDFILNNIESDSKMVSISNFLK